MMNWLSRFSNMVKKMEQHSQVQVLNFKTFPAVENSQIEFLEKKYNLTFPKSIFDFYQKTNGLQLRWVFNNNGHFLNKKDTLFNKNLEWDYFRKAFRWEDGGVMILPLENILEENILDAFSQESQLIFSKENFKVTISEDGNFSNDFFTTDFESYLEFLLAGKGLISRRRFFYKKPEEFSTKNEMQILTPQVFWTEQKTLQLDQAMLKDRFPFCDQVRFSQSHINRATLKMIADNGEQISQSELTEIIEKHHEFLLAGGVGGEWKVIEIRGMVTAFYNQNKEITEGDQAVFERKNIIKNNFEKVELPYSNFCAASAEGVLFSNSNFERSLFSDSFLKDASFYNSNFTGVDFSRSDLRNVNFKDSNLTNVDFENCDLRGANFDGAKWSGASFTGVIF